VGSVESPVTLYLESKKQMKNTENLHKLRHSAAHLLGHAVSELFPGTLLTIGPATDDGFFYDFLPSNNFKEENLEIIAKRMKEIVARKLPITHEPMAKTEARKLYKNNKFKLELIDGIEGDTVGIARQGDFYDLCKGGHVANTSELGNFELLYVAGSYWRADKNSDALQRIYGTIFFTPQELATYQQQREDALKYDHRKLGKELDLFSFHLEGTGFPFFHAKGKKILNIMTDYLRNLLAKADYKEVGTPAMLSDELWRRSGHYAHYKDNMYFCMVEDKQYAVKPMNCPGAILIYQERPRSYRELPLRLAEFGHVHRFELSGVLHGLFRARAFTIDDGHIFCTREQIAQEVKTAIDLTYEVLKKFGFETINVAVSTKPENAMGDDALWQTATNALTESLTAAGITYIIQEGEGAFYGPKIEFHIKDSMGRSWQCGTIQIDFFQPINFDLTYVAPSGTKERPVMIHRAIYGSFERFLGILIEHYKGALPFWLSPVQARLLTITDAQKPYAESVARELEAVGVRVEIDQSSDPLSGQIKSAQLAKIPWMIVIGGKEVENKVVTVRYRDGKQEMGLKIEDLIERAKAS
jgi:threonyl-tRNA synthetase